MQMCLKALESTTVWQHKDTGVQQCQQGGIHFQPVHAAKNIFKRQVFGYMKWYVNALRFSACLMEITYQN